MTYAVPELSSGQWLKRLHARGVDASYIGPQYARWALREQALPGILRLTPHYPTDDGKIERLGEALKDYLRQRAASWATLYEWQCCAAAPTASATPGDLRKVFVPVTTSVTGYVAHGRHHAV